MKKKVFAVLLIFVLAAMALLTGCGGKDDNGGTTPSGGGTTPSGGGEKTMKDITFDDTIDSDYYSSRMPRPTCTGKVLGLTEFDEQIFLDKVDHIEVPEGYVLDFFMKDGTVIRKLCPNTGHQDCWTKEYREKVSRKRKNTPRCRNATAFTGRIKCAECGNNYRRQMRKRSTGEKYYIYACATTNTCNNNCIHEDTLRELTAQALGQPELDEAVFLKEIDHISIAPGGHITFCFYDGHEVSMEYSTKRRMPGWTEERRAKQIEAIKASFTEERRRKMSETMKKIRSEKYWASTKAKR